MVHTRDSSPNSRNFYLWKERKKGASKRARENPRPRFTTSACIRQTWQPCNGRRDRHRRAGVLGASEQASQGLGGARAAHITSTPTVILRTAQRAAHGAAHCHRVVAVLVARWWTHHLPPPAHFARAERSPHRCSVPPVRPPARPTAYGRAQTPWSSIRVRTTRRRFIPNRRLFTRGSSAGSSPRPSSPSAAAPSTY